MKTSVALLAVGAVALAGAAWYFSRKQSSMRIATGGQPVNALPARQYAMNPLYNPNGRPPAPTPSWASWAPVAEGLLSGVTGPATDSSANPSTTDSYTGDLNFGGV
jgi:hypothetical protein